MQIVDLPPARRGHHRIGKVSFPNLTRCGNSPHRKNAADCLLAFTIRLSLLASDCGFEGFLELVDVRLVTLGVEERIRIARASCLQFYVLLVEAVEGCVRADPHIYWKFTGFL